MSRPIALITGGGRGIGAATARVLADAGYDLCINYASDTARAEQVAEQCAGLGARCEIVQADIADPNAVAAMFDHCDDRLGVLRVLVNNAGIIGQVSQVVDLPHEALSRTFEVNVYGAFYCAQEAVRRMRTDEGGAGGVIVNLSSIAAVLGSAGEYVHYAASKAAIDTFTVGLSKEVGPWGIRVNSIQAGTTDTEIHARSGNPGRPDMVAKRVPLGRVASPDDIAQAVRWLASDQASYATGAILKVGGGL